MKKKLLIAASASVPACITLGYLYHKNSPADVYYTFGWMVAVLVLLIAGNSLLSRFFDRRLPWLRFGVRRLVSQLLLGVVYSLGVINLAYLTFKWALTDEPPTTVQWMVTNAYGTVIFIPIFSIYFSYYFLKHWQRSELQAERFKKEKLKFELNNLKNHLDPHFLFNNLNILSSLIDYNPDESKVFLDKFADVYRAILKTRNQDLITLREELNVINAYIYLLRTRFEENIEFKIDITPGDLDKMLPPLTLQMLFENAIKHNRIGENRPLRIAVSSEAGGLKVSNTLFERKKEAVSGSGLDNIRSRYAYFSDGEIKCTKDEDHFTVCIPLIEVETV